MRKITELLRYLDEVQRRPGYDSIDQIIPSIKRPESVDSCNIAVAIVSWAHKGLIPSSAVHLDKGPVHLARVWELTDQAAVAAFLGLKEGA